MNLEQSLAIIVIGIGLCALAGVIANWWSHRDTVKQIADWENELVDRELAVQTERIQAQLTRSEAQMLRTETVMLREDAEKRYAEAAELVRFARRQLNQASAEAIELDDEMADTQLIEHVCDPDIDHDHDPVTNDTMHRTTWFDMGEGDDTIVRKAGQ